MKLDLFVTTEIARAGWQVRDIFLQFSKNTAFINDRAQHAITDSSLREPCEPARATELNGDESTRYENL